MQRTASKKYQKHGPIHISSILSFPWKIWFAHSSSS
jgi:hypothetical protein